MTPWDKFMEYGPKNAFREDMDLCDILEQVQGSENAF